LGTPSILLIFGGKFNEKIDKIWRESRPFLGGKIEQNFNEK
jgi:hypothetical protein